MRCRTHIAISNALMLLCMNPSNEKELLITMGVATIGGAIPDLDARKTETHKIVDFITLIVLVLILGAYLFDLNNNVGIFSTIKNGDYYFPLVGIVSLLLITFYGSHQPHRSFLHSFLGLLILTTVTYFCFGSIWIIFMLGMLSHFALDLLNKRGLKLFWPLKTGYCFNICDYNKTTDKVLFYTGIIICIIKLFVL